MNCPIFIFMVPIRLIIRIGLLVLGFIAPWSGRAQSSGSNVIYGVINMPQSGKRALVKRGDAYRNRGNVVLSDSKFEIDAANQPNRNVIVALYPLDFKPAIRPTPNAFLLQKDKTFVPNILPVTTGTTVIIENADDFYHNVFSITPGARFNIGRRPPKNRREQLINQSGEIKLFCDIHPQMNATILSLDTPYFVRVDVHGRYKLENLPDGAYQIRIFHPDLGWKQDQITLRSGEVKKQDIELNKESGIRLKP